MEAKNFSRDNVFFESGETTCKGYLYFPTNASGKAPCIVLAPGFTGTMDWLLPKYARHFVNGGYAVLIFDYRYFGQSGGMPRQLVNIQSQRQDIFAAIRYVRTIQNIDHKRIILWGTSLGGGNVFYAALEDPAIAAVICQIPAFDMVKKEARASIKIPAVNVFKLLAASVYDALRGWLGLEPYYIKVFGRPGETAIFTDQALKPNFDRLMAESKWWQNKFTPRFYLKLPRYKEGTYERLNIPVMVCIADKDVYANPDFQEKVGRSIPRGKVVRYPVSHFDFYHGLLSESVEDQLLFLNEVLRK